MEIANYKDLPKSIDYKKLPKFIKFDTNDEWLAFKQTYLGNKSNWTFDDRMMTFVKSS